MSLTLSELNSYVHNKIVDKTTDVIYKASPVFTRLSTKNMERFQGGLQIQRPIIVGELNGDALGRGEGMDIDFVTTDSALVNDLKVYYVNITLYGFDGMKDDGPEAVFNQVEMKFLNASLKMAKLLAQNMYLNGSDAGRTKHLNGLSEWYDNGTLFGTVGGVDRSDITADGTVGGLNAYTNTLTSFSLRDLNHAYGQAWIGSDHPDLIPVTQNAWELIWNALQPAQRYLDKESDIASTGFQAFRFNAAEVATDNYLPTGSDGVIFGLNTDYIEWYFSQNKRFQFGFTGFKEAANSIDVCGQFLVGSNLVVPNPRSGFKLLSTLF